MRDSASTFYPSTAASQQAASPRPLCFLFSSNQAGVFWYGLIPFMTRLKQTCPTSQTLCKLPRSHFIWSVRFLQPWPLPLASPASTCVWRPGMHLGQIAVIRRVLHIVPACCYLDTSSPGQPATPQEAARVFDAVRQFDHECPSSFPGHLPIHITHDSCSCSPPLYIPGGFRCPCAAARYFVDKLHATEPGVRQVVRHLVDAGAFEGRDFMRFLSFSPISSAHAFHVCIYIYIFNMHIYIYI